MSESAVRFDAVVASRSPARAQVIDIRTRRAWRPPDPRPWPFLMDVALIFSLGAVGAWLFLKMQGG